MMSFNRQYKQWNRKQQNAMAFTFPIETYAILEKQLGQEAALNLARTVEQAAAAVQQEANQLAQQKRLKYATR